MRRASRRGETGGSAGVEGASREGTGHVGFESGQLEILNGKLIFNLTPLESPTAGLRRAVMWLVLTICCRTVMNKWM